MIMIVRVTVSLDVDVDNWKLARFRGEDPIKAEVRHDVAQWVEERLDGSSITGQECAATLLAVTTS
jgi:hypothetical protein